MTELSTFNFNEQPIIVKVIDGEPWFLGANVCRVLEIKNYSDAYSRLKSYEKTIGNTEGVDNPDTVYVSESGLYRLVLTSRKPQAEPFQDWVVQEVLPTIRKTGSYSVQQMTPGQLLKLQAEAVISIELKQKEQEEQLLKHDSRLNTIEQRFQKADEVLKQLPPATVDVPTKSVRSCVNEVLRSYSYHTGDAYQSLWNVLYKEYKYRYHVDLKTRAKNEELKTLDYAEQFGVIDKVYALALELFSKD
jgi:prophage antirepressor-like protein